MLNKKKLKLLIRLLIVFLLFALVMRTIKFVNARYETTATSDAKLQVAFYVLKADYQTMTLNLDNFFPSTEPRTYNFSIGNVDGSKKAEVDLTYNLSIRTTTNLPLRYELYMNQSYKDSRCNRYYKIKHNYS